MGTELKPCPFCGQNPDIESYGEDGSFVCCSNFDCQLMSGFSPEEWNTRPIEDVLRNEITFLKSKPIEEDIIKLIKAERDALRIELDKADGAGQELMQENARLLNELSEALRDLRSARKRCVQIAGEAAEAQAEAQHLRNALRFYADSAEDGGAIAREALGNNENERTE